MKGKGVGSGGGRPRLLDLFCCAGGAARGYADAGFEVTGVDLVERPTYPFRFFRGDALAFVREHGREFDAIHASPPCQAYSRAGHLRKAQGGTCSAADLLGPTRDALIATGLPFVIENVPGAPMEGLTLCGSMFGLAVRRHRVFECSFFVLQPFCDHPTQGRPVGVYHRMADEVPHGGRTARTLEEAQRAMGIDWMGWDELKEAIPPAYTRYIGEALLAHIAVAQEAAA